MTLIMLALVLVLAAEVAYQARIVRRWRRIAGRWQTASAYWQERAQRAQVHIYPRMTADEGLGVRLADIIELPKEGGHG